MPAVSNIKLLNSHTGDEIKVDYPTLRKTLLILRSVNHKLRQQIIAILRDTPALTVTDIYIKMRLEQSVASQHLAILRRSGIVITSREGKFVNYTLNKVRLKEVKELINELTSMD